MRSKLKTTAFVNLVFALSLPGFCAAQTPQHVPGAHHDFGDVGKWSELLEGPERDRWQHPDEVVKHLNLKPGDVVADIGAGTGYFTRRFAAAVAPGGKAIGIEIEPAMVEHMKEEALKLDLKNFEPRLAKPNDPGLAPASVDLIFVCDTYHHLSNRADYFRKLARSLKTKGRVVIVDFYQKAMPVGPEAPEDKISETTVLKELGQAGYRLRHADDFLPYQYFLEFSL